MLEPVSPPAVLMVWHAGGTVGDIESTIYYEAIRQLKQEGTHSYIRMSIFDHSFVLCDQNAVYVLHH